MDRNKKEPCGDMAQKDNHYSTKSFIRIKVFHGMKHDGLRNLFEVAKKKAIRKRRKYPVSGKDNRGVYHATR